MAIPATVNVACVCILAALCALANAEDCCASVASDEPCYSACAQLFAEVQLNIHPSQVQAISSACSSTYVQFWICFNETATSIEPATVAPTEAPTTHVCCDLAEENHCRDTCNQFVNHPSPDEAISLVINACGPPPHGLLWQCLLDPPTEPPAGTEIPSLEDVDLARIQCCHKARADECRSSCLELYTGTISSLGWQTFQLDCVHRPSEHYLSTCLADVTAPCKPGCTGMQFCTNFNNRPTDSFRQCTTSADRMAKNDFYSWDVYGTITHPLVNIFVENVRQCLPEMWKAVACILYIQPCQPTTHTTQICREDCIHILSECSSNSSADPTAVCDIIAPASTNDYCIPLSQFDTPSPYTTTQVSTISNPCKPNPCSKGFFCSVNHVCRSNDIGCPTYTCQPGCVVEGHLLLPEGSAVKVVLGSEDKCYGYFNCSSPKETIQFGFQYCEENDSCSVGNDTYAHETTFWNDCNFCSCFHGRLTCTNRRCSPESNTSMAYVNCNCSADYDPVCTPDGRTIPNKCIASCLGYTNQAYHSGYCGSGDSCSNSNCADKSRCVPSRHMCLSKDPVNIKCNQFLCAPVDQDCIHMDISSDLVCDSSNSQHPNLCALLRTQEEFGYFGYCRSECSRLRSEQVCGVNGETFKTQCHAESMNIAVDYTGPCKAVPAIGPDGLSCADVTCPSHPNMSCITVTPRDACCPKCGAHLTILMDKDSMYRNTEAVGRQSIFSTDIVKRLQHYITILQCNLYGHVSIDGSLSVLVLPVVNTSSPLVIDACIQEAVRLATIINNRTPLLSSDPILSHLIAAHVETAEVNPLPVTDPDIDDDDVDDSDDTSRSGIGVSPVSRGRRCLPEVVLVFLCSLLLLVLR